MVAIQFAPQEARRKPFTQALELLKGRVKAFTRGGSIAPNRHTSNLLRLTRSYEFTESSDQVLKRSIYDLAQNVEDAPQEQTIAKTFAIVSEAISRRLGAWRLFDADFDKRGMGRYYNLACQIVASGPYRDAVGFYADADFLEGDAFAESIAPLLRQMSLDCDEETLVKTIVYVIEKSNVDYWPNMLLPAQFYQAVSAKDVEGGLRFHATDEQIIAGLLMLEGGIVEMNAGEGKTIAAAFPAVMHALSGKPVHIITSNDYLATRDADWLAPVYESLSVSVGAVLASMGDDERGHAYSQQIVYGTLREFGFDFLRDNLKLPPNEANQGALDVVIIDEADHVLIDQARTPLIISGPPIGNRRAFKKAHNAVKKLVSQQSEAVKELEDQIGDSVHGCREQLTLLAKLLLADPESDVLRNCLAGEAKAYKRVKAMAEDDDFENGESQISRDFFYTVDAERDSVMLTERGQAFLEKSLGPIFDTTTLEQELDSLDLRGDIALDVRERLVSRLSRRIARQNSQMNQVLQMLRAYVLLRKNVNYVVDDGQIVLIDEYTGRTLPDNRYQHGLHAALEAKEGVSVHPEHETLAQISVQGFLKQYAHVSGMTGTALDSLDELEREYGLTVTAIPSSKPQMRKDFGPRLYLNRREKLGAIVDEIRLCAQIGRPVLVGTPTIEQSEEISRLLEESGIEHNLLNAVNSEAEAEIIRNAGRFGAVTVATNMAGRGTDILLEPGLNERIASACRNLAEKLSDEGISRIEFACSTSEEATMLSNALSDLGNILVTVEGSCVVIKIMPTDENSVDSFVRLEFGLGLCVIGTEMNQSGRIDRQLRGRSGRQGEFGASRFIVSLEDQLLAFRGDNASCMSDSAQRDSAGRTFFEGPRLERHLDEIQGEVECDDSVVRGLMHEYDRILEEQTLAYYSARSEVIGISSLHEIFESFAREYAARFVDMHFPELRLWDYQSQFNDIAEELWLDFEIDCRDFEGLGLDMLSEAIGDLLLIRLENLREGLGDARATELGKLLFLQTADEKWREHITDIQELTLNAPLTALSHKTAVADSIIQGFEAYELFKQGVVDTFIIRFLNFEVENVAESESIELNHVEDLERILV